MSRAGHAWRVFEYRSRNIDVGIYLRAENPLSPDGGDFTRIYMTLKPYKEFRGSSLRAKCTDTRRSKINESIRREYVIGES